jgi:hypothetical protein
MTSVVSRTQQSEIFEVITPTRVNGFQVVNLQELRLVATRPLRINMAATGLKFQIDPMLERSL